MKLDAFLFGRKLLEANDLDPVYVLLWNADLSPEKLRKWLLAYWCFYRVGTASWIAGAQEYWLAFNIAAASKEYPRCHERRHFRGENARKSVAYLQSRGINSLFRRFDATERMTAEEVIDEAIQWVGFGPWISFKVADMLERLAIVDVQFSAKVAMYEGSPMDGARLLWTIHSNDEDHLKNVGEWAAKNVSSALSEFKAPPRNERSISFQEAETILCKWKSYVGGHYTIGEDIRSCRSGLLRFPKCRTSQRPLQAGKKGGLW